MLLLESSYRFFLDCKLAGGFRSPGIGGGIVPAGPARIFLLRIPVPMRNSPCFVANSLGRGLQNRPSAVNRPYSVIAGTEAGWLDRNGLPIAFHNAREIRGKKAEL